MAGECTSDFIVRDIAEFSTDDIFKISISTAFRKFKEYKLNSSHLSCYKAYFTACSNECFNYIFNLLTCFPASNEYSKEGILIELEGQRGFIPSGLYDFKDKIPDEANKRFHVVDSKEKIPEAYKLNLGELKNKIINTEEDIEFIEKNLLNLLFLSSNTEAEGRKYKKYFLTKAKNILANTQNGLLTLVRDKDGNREWKAHVSIHDLFWITLQDMLEENLLPEKGILVINSCRGGKIFEIKDRLVHLEQLAHDGVDGSEKADDPMKASKITCNTIPCTGTLSTLRYGTDPDTICKGHGCLGCEGGFCIPCENNNVILVNIDGNWYCFTVDEIYSYFKNFNKSTMLPYSSGKLDLGKLITHIFNLDIDIPWTIVIATWMMKNDNYEPAKQIYKEFNDSILNINLKNILLNKREQCELLRNFLYLLKTLILPFIHIDEAMLLRYIDHTFSEQLIFCIKQLYKTQICYGYTPTEKELLNICKGSKILSYIIEVIYFSNKMGMSWVKNINHVVSKGEDLFKKECESSDSLILNLGQMKIQK